MSANDPSSPQPTPDFVPTQPDPVVQPGYAAFPAPGVPMGQPEPPATIPGEPVAAPATVVPGAERVGRGLLFSLGGIVVGVVLTVIVWRMNFVASITSFAMAYACVWLYAKGAGSAPRKGALGVVAVIVVGVLACLAAIVASDTLAWLDAEYPGTPGALKFQVVLENLLAPEVWAGYGSEVAMYVLFAALGTFGLIRQLGRARGA
jgi:hypothetical protein